MLMDNSQWAIINFLQEAPGESSFISLSPLNPFMRIMTLTLSLWNVGDMLSILLVYLILVPVFLKNHPSCPEILWYLRCFTDKKERLTFKANPHFYANLPTSLNAHGDNLKIDPTKDFQQADTFYVLPDRQEPVLIHIMIGNRILHSFGNLWHYKNTIIFKGLGNPFIFPLFLTF